MANTKESRVIRTRNIALGTISFLDKPSGKTLICDMRDLFPSMSREEFDKFWANLPAITRHLFLHGVNGKVGDTVAAKDKDGFVTMSDSWAALVAGIWSSGGGGSPLDTYTVVLRQAVSDILVSIGTKRVDANKAAAKDCVEAYMIYAESIAATLDNGTGQNVFDVMFPKVESAAKKEAERQDKARPKAPTTLDDSVRAAILAKATQDEKPAAKIDKAA